MRDTVFVTITRKNPPPPPSKGKLAVVNCPNNSITKCPNDQCDITVVVRERGGEKRTIKDVNVNVIGYKTGAQTNDKGTAYFKGFTQEKGYNVAITLGEEAKKAYILVNKNGTARKTKCDGKDELRQKVKKGEDKLFTFLAMPRPELTVEVKRYDGKALSGPPADVKIVNDNGTEKDFFQRDKITLSTGWDVPVDPGKYTITAQKPDEKWDGTVAEEKDWKLGPSEDGIVKVELPPGANEHVTFTLTPYKQVQFIGFQIKTGEYDSKNKNLVYLGNEDAEKDIKKRCAILKNAIEKACDNDKIEEGEEVLKVFMAPEFYFRGFEAGYPIENISKIMGEMGKETSKPKYKDWLFVYGTAIGYLAHGTVLDKPLKGGKAKHYTNVRIESRIDDKTYHLKCQDNPDVCKYILPTEQNNYNWKIQKGAKSSLIKGIQKKDVYETNWLTRAQKKNTIYEISLNKDARYEKGPVALLQPEAKGDRYLLRVKEVDKTLNTIIIEKHLDEPNVCARIPKQCPVQWKVVQGAIEAEIQSAKLVKDGNYELMLKNPASFSVGPCYLIEPEAIEIFNIALVQKGGSKGGNLRQLIVYKEYISYIDYRSAKYGNRGFNTVNGRKIEFRGDQMTVLPTEGSGDMLSGIINEAKKSQVGVAPEDRGPRKVSEYNRTGLGGGSIFTIDGINFGLEVCLDHAQKRLRRYANPPPSGEPRPQIQLIPSAGMEILKDSVECVDEGLVFNVDHANKPKAIIWDGDINHTIGEKETLTEVRTGMLSGVTDSKYYKDSGEIVIFEVEDIPPAETY